MCGKTQATGMRGAVIAASLPPNRASILQAASAGGSQMLKLTGAVVAIVLAGSASAAGWRTMRIGASSEASFKHAARRDVLDD